MLIRRTLRLFFLGMVKTAFYSPGSRKSREHSKGYKRQFVSQYSKCVRLMGGRKNMMMLLCGFWVLCVCGATNWEKKNNTSSNIQQFIIKNHHQKNKIYNIKFGDIQDIYVHHTNRRHYVYI